MDASEKIKPHPLVSFNYFVAEQIAMLKQPALTTTTGTATLGT